MTKKDVKKFWENNKKKILIGGSVIVGGLVGLTIYKSKTQKNIFSDLTEINLTPFLDGATKPSRPIPNVEGFNILDIADDVEEGCVTWLDGCKLADCGKLGEGLTKIERIDPDMMVTMVIMAKSKLEL